MNRKKNIPSDDPGILKMILGVIGKEKQQSASPFLTGRVMHSIQAAEKKPVIALPMRVLRVMAVAAGFLLIVFIGINLGSLLTEERFPASEVMSINDAYLERIDLMIND